MDNCRAPYAEQNAERAAEQAAEVASVEQQLADVQAALTAVEQRGQRVRARRAAAKPTKSRRPFPRDRRWVAD